MVLSRSFWWLRRCLLRSSSGLDKDEIASEIEKLEEVDHVSDDTITLDNCHPDLELFGCQGNFAGDNLSAAAIQVPFSSGAQLAPPEMPTLGCSAGEGRAFGPRRAAHRSRPGPACLRQLA